MEKNNCLFECIECGTDKWVVEKYYEGELTYECVKCRRKWK